MTVWAFVIGEFGLSAIISAIILKSAIGRVRFFLWCAIGLILFLPMGELILASYISGQRWGELVGAGMAVGIALPLAFGWYCGFILSKILKDRPTQPPGRK